MLMTKSPSPGTSPASGLFEGVRVSHELRTGMSEVNGAFRRWLVGASRGHSENRESADSDDRTIVAVRHVGSLLLLGAIIPGASAAMTKPTALRVEQAYPYAEERRRT
jgi:hypothetical protein